MRHEASIVERYSEVRRVLWVTLGLNWLTALLKLVVGQASGSLSMVADGYHSLVDGASNVAGLMAMRYAYRPADADHQYGHRKYETVSSMAIGIALFAAAFRILSAALGRLGGGPLPQVGVTQFAVMLLTLAINIGVSTWERRAGQRLRSSFLTADAAHTRSDVFATSSVIASLVAVRLGVAWVDLAAAVFIAGVIVRVGIGIIRQGLGVLSDQMALDPAAVEREVLAIAGVEGCGRIRSRGTEDHVFVDLVCRVDHRLSVGDAHQLADRIEHRIQAAFPQVKDIVVHLEPQGPQA